MTINSISLMGSGVQGIHAGIQLATEAATAIAAGPSANREGEAADLATSLTELKLSEQQVVASTKVVKSADEMLGRLIDTLA